MLTMDEVKYAEAVKAIAKMIAKIREVVYTFIDSLEPYQKFEALHPRKKPRGSIRRTKHGRN